MWSTSLKRSNTSGRTKPWVSEMTPTLIGASCNVASWRPATPLAPPPLDERDLEAQMIEDTLHDEVHEIAHLLWPVIEPGRGGEHDRAGFRDEREVPQVDERQRRLARDQHQGAALLEHDVCGALDETAARAVRHRRHRPHRARADHHPRSTGGARRGLRAAILVVEHADARPIVPGRPFELAVILAAALPAEACGIKDDRELTRGPRDRRASGRVV